MSSTAAWSSGDRWRRRRSARTVSWRRRFSASRSRAATVGRASWTFHHSWNRATSSSTMACTRPASISRFSRFERARPSRSSMSARRTPGTEATCGAMSRGTAMSSRKSGPTGPFVHGLGHLVPGEHVGGGAGAAHDDVGFGQGGRQPVQWRRLSTQEVCQGLGRPKAPVGHRQSTYAPPGEGPWLPASRPPPYLPPARGGPAGLPACGVQAPRRRSSPRGRCVQSRSHSERACPPASPGGKAASAGRVLCPPPSPWRRPLAPAEAPPTRRGSWSQGCRRPETGGGPHLPGSACRSRTPGPCSRRLRPLAGAGRRPPEHDRAHQSTYRTPCDCTWKG